MSAKNTNTEKMSAKNTNTNKKLEKNFNTNTETSKFHWHDMNMLQVEKQFKNILCKISYENLTYKTVNMKTYTETRHSPKTPGCLELTKVYSLKFLSADNNKKRHTRTCGQENNSYFIGYYTEYTF